MRPWILVLILAISQATPAATLIVGMEEANNSPFEYLDEEINLTGFHVELVRQVVERLGWEASFRRFPWKRTMHALEKGEVHAVTYVARSEEREQFANFLPDNLLHVSRTTLYIRRDRASEIHYIPPLREMVWRWRTAMPSGYYMSDELEQLVAQGAPIERPTVTQTQLFVMLISGRFDAVFGATNSIEWSKEEVANLEKQVQRLDGALFPGKRMYIAFSRKANPRLVTEFAEAYRHFRDEPEYRKLAERFDIAELLPEPHEFM